MPEEKIIPEPKESREFFAVDISEAALDVPNKDEFCAKYAHYLCAHIRRKKKTFFLSPRILFTNNKKRALREKRRFVIPLSFFLPLRRAPLLYLDLLAKIIVREHEEEQNTAVSARHTARQVEERKNFGRACRTCVSCGGHMARQRGVRRDSGVRWVSRKVLTVNSFPGGARLESARGAALPSRSLLRRALPFRPCLCANSILKRLLLFLSCIFGTP